MKENTITRFLCVLNKMCAYLAQCQGVLGGCQGITMQFATVF